MLFQPLDAKAHRLVRAAEAVIEKNADAVRDDHTGNPAVRAGSGFLQVDGGTGKTPVTGLLPYAFEIGGAHD